MNEYNVITTKGEPFVVYADSYEIAGTTAKFFRTGEPDFCYVEENVISVELLVDLFL